MFSTSDQREPNPFMEDQEAIMLEPVMNRRIKSGTGMSKYRAASSTRASTHMGRQRPTLVRH